MKIYQVLLLTESYKVNSFISQKPFSHKNNQALNKDSQRADSRVDQPIELWGPVDLSFHPYLISAHSEVFVPDSDQSKIWELSLDIKLNNDENNQPLFAKLNQNRSLLLIAELNTSLGEALDALGFELKKLSPNPLGLELSIITNNKYNNQQLVGVFMILLNILDSLLFARGLCLSEPRIRFLKGGDKTIITIFNKIIFGACAADFSEIYKPAILGS